MSGAVARYQEAAQRGDIDLLMTSLSADVVLISPLSGRLVFRGHHDLRILLSAVYRSLHGLEWTEERGDDAVRFAVAHARLGPLTLSDVTAFDLDEDGLVRLVRPHLRPWLALSVLGVVVAARLARRPGVLVRAWARAGDGPSGAARNHHGPELPRRADREFPVRPRRPRPVVRQVPVPKSVTTRCVLDRVDYQDAFALADPAEHPARVWVDALAGGAPGWMRRPVRVLQKHLLGLRLGPDRSTRHPLGWHVLTDDPGTVVLGVEGGLITPRLVLTVEEGQVVVSTLLRYDHPLARCVWAMIAPIHRAVARRLLRGSPPVDVGGLG